MNAIAAVFYRDYRQRITNAAFLVWDLMVPLAYLLLFGLGFERLLGGAITLGGQQVGYTAFLLPGILAMVTFYVALNTSWGFFMDKDSGIFYELLTFPITRRTIADRQDRVQRAGQPDRLAARDRGRGLRHGRRDPLGPPAADRAHRGRHDRRLVFSLRASLRS